jgi:hypothetical protein
LEDLLEGSRISLLTTTTKYDVVVMSKKGFGSLKTHS